MSIIKPEDLAPVDPRLSMNGWYFTNEDLAQAINNGEMRNPTFEGMTNYCKWNCSHCFTQRNDGPKARKLRLATELSLLERLSIIQQAAALGAKTINFVGAGEPTTDPHFWALVEGVAGLGLVPVVFTEASLQLTKVAFAKRLYDLGATVVIKADSLWNRDYQNAMVAGTFGVDGAENYFDLRNRAIEICCELGFNACTPTRLGFDTIVTRGNQGEMSRRQRYVREHNIFPEIKGFLHTGRAREARVDSLGEAELQAVWNEFARIDAKEFGIIHDSTGPFGGSLRCPGLRSTGVHITIEGKVFRCDGEEDPIGDLRRETLETVWHRVRRISQNIMGGCPPRERFARHQAAAKRHLPIL